MGGKNGSVVLFLRNLPKNVSRRELKLFIRDELRKSGVRRGPLLNLCSNCTILRITSPATGLPEYHGLVEIQPARMALQAIQALNGKLLEGTPIEVRRYRHRSSWGERRHGPNEAGEDRREAQQLRERRRANLKIELVDTTPGLPLFTEMPILT